MKPDTLAVHPPAAPAPDATNAPVAPPIHPAASFEGDPEHLAALLQGDGEGFVYARYMNPTCVGVERALAALEGGEGAVWCASGMAALTAVLSTRLQTGDEVLCAARIYGVTAALLTRIVARQGVQVRFGDADTLTAGPRTRVILAETIANPGLETADLPGLAARKGDAWLVIDNTFSSPALCRPLEHGADVVVHSASKYIGGHGDLIAGAVVADAVKAAAIRSVASTMGLTGDPWTAFLAARGLKTLPLRMARHSSNARAVAACLRGLGLPVRAAAPRPWLSDTGGMLCVDLPDRQTAFAFLRALRLFRCATSLGDCHSMALHPASTSHRDFDAAALTAAGITQGTLRLSVGLEDPSDLCADLEQAVAALPS